MRKVSIRQFRANMAKELDNVPFILTRAGIGDYVICTHTDEKACTPSNKRVHKVDPFQKAEKDLKRVVARPKVKTPAQCDKPGSCPECKAMYGHRSTCSRRRNN